MQIIWAGMTVGRLKFKKIDWRCDCGQRNLSSGSEWNRVLTCLRCGKQYEVECMP